MPKWKFWESNNESQRIEIKDFYKCISVLKSCKSFDQFCSAENFYNNYKVYYYGLTLYEYHKLDDLWDEMWYKVLWRVE